MKKIEEIVTERETAFDPSKPFKTRDGRSVTDIFIEGYTFIEGRVEGRPRAWWKSTGCVYYGGDGLDLVNVPPAAPVVQPGTEDAEPLVFTYRNYRGEIAERRVMPKGVRWGSTEWHPEPQWLLLGFDLDKQADREFAMQDIAPAKRGLTGDRS